MSDSEWWKKAVFYQIYPRSFMDSNNDGVGDLQGIIKKLDYIEKLGVDALWISPFYPSPMKDFGYDISDYEDIDPLFGSLDDFDELLNQAHGKGVKIIVDMVLSHTSDQHAWFIESRKNRDNPKADWYVWVDGEKGKPPNNWVSVFGGSAWQWDETRQQYYLHNFLTQQPDLNYHNPEVRDAVLGVCKFWLNKGVDGFRFDVMNFIYHDSQLRDNPLKGAEDRSAATQFDGDDPYNRQYHVYDKSRPEAVGFLSQIRALMDQYPQTMTLAEVGCDQQTIRAAEYVAGSDRLHTAYSFSLMTGDELTASQVRSALTEFFDQPGDGWPSWAFSNHDVIRPITRWGKNIKDKEAFAKLLIKLLLSLKGTPFIYQGEELGLTEADIAFDDIQDPWGKHLWPQWQGRDGCRTPMPWQADLPAAGFSKLKETWLPMPPEHKVRAVNTQDSDPNSVLSSVRDFIRWRKTKPVLQQGEIQFLETKNDKILAFYRTDGAEKILCVFNLSEDLQVFDLLEEQELLPLSASFQE